MDLVLFNLVFESQCLNVGTYVVHLFLGYMDFEFVKPCWLVLFELLLLDVHGNGHAFVLETCEF